MVHNKDRIEPIEKAGIYQINCNNCNCSYVGQSGRSIKIRVNEHNKLICNNNVNTNPNVITKSAFATHILQFNHNFEPNNNTKILHICNKGWKLNFLEMMEITRVNNINNNDCLNEVKNFNNNYLFLKILNL